MVDAVVIGGGIVGMSTAYSLVCAGAETVLIDRADAGRATDAGAGILSPETNTRDPDIWFDLAVEEKAHWAPGIHAWPYFDSLRGDSRFESIRERVGL